MNNKEYGIKIDLFDDGIYTWVRHFSVDDDIEVKTYSTYDLAKEEGESTWGKSKYSWRVEEYEGYD